MNWARRIRGALGMGVIWALGWGVGNTLLAAAWSLGLPLDSWFKVFDAPAPAMAMPGFIAGVLFALVLGLLARGRRFSDVSFARFSVYGLLAGVLLAFVPMAIGGTASGGRTMWDVTLIFLGPSVLFSTLSAAGYYALARRATRDIAREADEPEHVG